MVETPHPLADVDWPLRTERLVIRRATADHLDATWSFRRLPEIREWLTAAPETRAEYAEKFLKFVDWAEADRRYGLAVKG